ncbi:MAG: hypothetical protein RL497_97 [Pseudomonadota bacterium]|jgi:anti-sigma-K factor RskA
MSELTSLTTRNHALALEYVLGTLRGAERRAFEKALTDDAELQNTVAAWEETLMALPGPTPQAAPASTWGNIETALNAQPKRANEAKRSPFVRSVAWVGSLAAVCLLALGVWFNTPQNAPEPVLAPAPSPVPSSAPATQRPELAWRASYVAVLTDENGKAQLTALTQSQGEPPNAQHKLKLHSTANTTTLQIWAMAENGSVQKLAVLEPGNTEPLALSKEQWVLIKAAKELLLTEASDSAQPGRVLAKGPCVQLAQQPAPQQAPVL